MKIFNAKHFIILGTKLRDDIQNKKIIYTSLNEIKIK
jgi:hypothetical protein